MVSNAALKSRNARMVKPLLSRADKKWFCTQTRTVSVLWHALYADCRGSWRLFTVMYSVSHRKVRLLTG